MGIAIQPTGHFMPVACHIPRLVIQLAIKKPGCSGVGEGRAVEVVRCWNMDSRFCGENGEDAGVAERDMDGK